MNIKNKVKLEIRDLLEALAHNDFTKISINNWYGRLNKEDIETRISEYGRTLTPPPDSFMEKAYIYNYEDGSGLKIDVPLWTIEEGISDLTLSLELIHEGDNEKLQMSDLHVL
ncbi:DUF7668 domain-containing protein [Pseudomonas viridiflava]|uniref:DUF7668 domain-containing protein n=1 Tax=Pseudomonas viridiflava TaxID=33069 RepID=UPI000F04073F|nr:hypothetical protein [Pseudomonas viridiflava]